MPPTEFTETGLAMSSFRGHYGENPPTIRRHTNFRTTRAGRVKYEKAGLAIFDPDQIEEFLGKLSELEKGKRRATAIRDALASGKPPEAIPELGNDDAEDDPDPDDAKTKVEAPTEAGQEKPQEPAPPRSKGVTNEKKDGQGTEPLRRTKADKKK